MILNKEFLLTKVKIDMGSEFDLGNNKISINEYNSN